MKIFWLCSKVKVNIKLTVLAFIACCAGCATHHPQFGVKTLPVNNVDTLSDEVPHHRIYLVGDAGYADQPQSEQLLGAIRKKITTENKNTSLVFLGDNIYPYGMPPKTNEKDRIDAEAALDSQLSLANGFPGKIYFIPGNHDWYNGLQGLKEQETYIRERLKDKHAFLPGKGCGINDIDIDNTTVLIVVDSQWFIEDWDNYPTINDDCSIKSREGLFTELESLLNKNQDKTILLAIHHPLMTRGAHGGYYSAEKHLFPLKYNIPLPVLGSVINILRRASGYSPQDLQNKVYRTLSDRIKTLLQDKDNVIVISGHDHNLQYICQDNIHQIISGSGSKKEAARALNPGDFSYGGAGYATLDIYSDGHTKATFYGVQDGKEVKLFERVMLEKKDILPLKYPDEFPHIVKASVYSPEDTTKTGFYNFLMGEHYRDYYALPIEVPVVVLDTIYGGLVPDRAGGGHQSKSLRLKGPDGKEYVMRGLRKSTSRFLQSVVFKDEYIGDSFEDTYVEEFLMDFYTTSHPYTPFILDDLADSAGIYHSNPQLFYVPKQNALGNFNTGFGDELYMFEERPIDEHSDLESFGLPDAIEGTDDVFKNLRKDKKYIIDERAYIRARLFDMLVGDWDRHADQWRWARFDEKDRVVYRPIPRDRDQAFPKYGGVLLSAIMNIPPVRHMQSYEDDIDNIKWFNVSAYPLDVAFLTSSGEDIWLEEAKHLRESLTDAVIDKAFLSLPKEVQDDTSESIKSKLKKRRTQLEKFAKEYRKVLLKTIIVTGSDRKDRFLIKRLPAGETQIQVYSTTKNGSEIVSVNQIYNKKQTKEIWIYGLDDDDFFEVKGTPDQPILIRLLGGQNNDTYAIEEGKNIVVYDFKSKTNTYDANGRTRIVLTDDYETNSYDYTKPKYNVAAGYPMAGYNPDDGIKIGVLASYTVNNFNRRPYSHKHSLKINYFFATQGFELGYKGRFMNISSQWNFGLDAMYTSPNFSINYFGLGNDTENFDDNLGMDYNRVKLQLFRVAPSIFRENRNGSSIEFQIPFETIEVEGTYGRFVNQPGAINTYLFEHRLFGGATAKYSFSNYDNNSLPAMGMALDLLGGWKTSLDDTGRNFPYAEGALNVVHRLTRDNILVFATTIKGKMLLGDDFEFYQAATLGGEDGLRSFRRERFTGRHSLSHSSDLRLTLGKLKSFVPMKYGLLGGFDYGRVWITDDTSDKWHNSAGSGIWLNGAGMATGSLSYFYGSDGGRIAFALRFGL